jgi:hypothetical protein
MMGRRMMGRRMMGRRMMGRRMMGRRMMAMTESHSDRSEEILAIFEVRRSVL